MTNEEIVRELLEIRASAVGLNTLAAGLASQTERLVNALRQPAPLPEEPAKPRQRYMGWREEDQPAKEVT